jgi:L-glyceraldehyde 3-phosphate reductase
MNVMTTYEPLKERYNSMRYRKVGRSGLRLPLISLGLWQNFGFETPLASIQQILRTAFDHGITHFDLANNYGPPYGSAEIQFGEILHRDFMPFRDELIISTKAGYDMWPGPYGDGGSRKYLLSSLDQSLSRMGLEYVDIFYSHRVDPETPLEETMGALATAVQQGKALYVGISSYGPELTVKANQILKSMGVPCLIHQPSYSMFNRWIESEGLLDTLNSEGIGAIVFSPLAQGLLSGKYISGIPKGARAAQPGSFDSKLVTEDVRQALQGLHQIADSRNQTLSQLAVSWVLREPTVASALVGVRTNEQLLELIGATEYLGFSDEELVEIEGFAKDFDLNLWEASSRRTVADFP